MKFGPTKVNIVWKKYDFLLINEKSFSNLEKNGTFFFETLFPKKEYFNIWEEIMDDIQDIKELVKILACPACKADVELRKEEVICTRCRRRYPIRDGIPIMLIEEAKYDPIDY